MSPQVPGLSLSLIRSATSVQAGSPLLISGRFTVLGLGAPAFIRVFLKGPSYNPESTHFDAMAQPFSGEFNVQVTPDKDGEYQVSAQAYPIPALPSGPLVPETIPLVPAIAEAPEVPIVAGLPTAGGVNAQTPSGTQFLQSPSLSPIEVSTGGVSISLPSGASSGGGGLIQIIAPTTPYQPPAPKPPTPIIPTTRFITAVAGPGGQITPQGAIQVEQGASQSFIITPNEGYSVSQVTVDGVPLGAIGTYNFPAVTANHSISAVFVPVGAALPTPPTPAPTFPSSPNSTMLGTPIFGLPSQLSFGDAWNGNVSIPTVIPANIQGAASLVPGSPQIPAYSYRAAVSLEDPDTAQMTQAASTTISTQLGNPINVPVSYNTQNLQVDQSKLPKRYAVFLTIMNQAGNTIFNSQIGSLYLLAMAGITPPSLPAPTLPTAAMLGTPSLSLPAQVIKGDSITGNISVPTMWPASLAQPPKLPTYGLSLYPEFRGPNGVLYPQVSGTSLNFQPGQPLSVPVSYNSATLPEGDNEVLLLIKDAQKNTLFESIIGKIKVAAAAVPTPPTPPTPPIPTPPGVPVYNPNHQYTFTWSEPGPLGYIGNIAGMEQLIQKVFDASNIPANVIDVYGTWGSSSVVFTPKVVFQQSLLPSAQAQLQQVIYAQQGVPSGGGGAVPSAIATLLVITDPLTQGGALQYKYSNFQPNSQVSIYVQGGGGVTSTADSNGAGQGSFYDNDPPKDYMLVAEDQYGHKATRPFTVQGFVGPVLPQGQPTLTTGSSPKQGGVLSFNFSGFQPYAQVNVYVEGGGGVTATANSSGAGSGSFTDNDTPAAYTLVATDSYNHRATASFQVLPSANASAALPTLKVGSSPTQGGVLSYSFSGFAPNSTVSVYVQGGGGVTNQTNASGSGSGSFYDNDPPGSYTLIAEDSAGHRATVPFTVR